MSWYNQSTWGKDIEKAYSELAQQRKRGRTKSRGIDPDITEGKITAQNITKDVKRFED